MKKLAFIVILGLLTGCAVSTPTGVQVVSANFKPIILFEVTTNTVVTEYGEGTVILPAGVYQPDFQANEGVFYRAPARILFFVPFRLSPHDYGKSGDLKTKSIVTGGLLVSKPAVSPSPTDVWYEPLSGGAGEPPRIYHLKSAVAVRLEQ